ncbi:hypothetical protein TNCV_1794521 [Trichonephila clavipes]|nr:hypothetical protein TNCV_1794521 [Trichonephila clavipes]
MQMPETKRHKRRGCTQNACDLRLRVQLKTAKGSSEERLKHSLQVQVLNLHLSFPLHFLDFVGKELLLILASKNPKDMFKKRCVKPSQDNHLIVFALLIGGALISEGGMPVSMGTKFAKILNKDNTKRKVTRGEFHPPSLKHLLSFLKWEAPPCA